MSVSKTAHVFDTPYEARHGRRAISERNCKLERHEILHFLRGQLEAQHRKDIWCFQVREQYRPEIGRPAHLRPIRYSRALDFRNKSVPIYICEGEAAPLLRSLLFIFLHNYLYHRWFHPYQSDIEYGQFIAKVIYAKGRSDTGQLSSIVDLVTTLKESICSRLDEIRQAVQAAELPYTQRKIELHDIHRELGVAGDYFEGLVRLPHYAIRPLFKAVAIVICGQDYNSCYTITDRTGKLPVLVFLTGHTDGLSAPITFDFIAHKAELAVVNGRRTARTDLETAVDFITALEAREEAAFGPQPDPVLSTAVPGQDDEHFNGVGF